MALDARLLVAIELRRLVSREAGNFSALDALFQALEAPGKVLGPDGRFAWGSFTYRICDAARVEPDTAALFGAAMECFIAALDVLDDVQDGDVPEALWRFYSVATATNVATLLLFLSQQSIKALADRGVPAERALAVARILSEAGRTACIGQQRDLDQQGTGEMEEDDYLAMIGQKSACVVAAICRAAAVLGRRSDETIEAFTRFGFNVGMAMQLLNDVSGCSDESATRNDLRTSKQTLPVIFGLNWAAKPIREELTSLLDTNGREISPDAVLRVRSLLASCGGLQYAEVVADVYWERALCMASNLGRDGAVLGDIIGELRGDPVGALR